MKLSVSEETYWKLLELKARLRAKTWDELLSKVCELLGVGKSNQK